MGHILLVLAPILPFSGSPTYLIGKIKYARNVKIKYWCYITKMKKSLTYPGSVTKFSECVSWWCWGGSNSSQQKPHVWLPCKMTHTADGRTVHVNSKLIQFILMNGDDERPYNIFSKWRGNVSISAFILLNKNLINNFQRYESPTAATNLGHDCTNDNNVCQCPINNHICISDKLILFL